ncbi:hypothetical protein [Sorangium sp. So ce362]|uniref:hypothetical protein n=1 Tax=Sorangium sp. So ce362 TaxID=3133303 RepID=UPI003F603F69
MHRRREAIKPGDVLQGTGGLRVLVRVESVDGTKAHCTLVRSGNPKTLSLATLRSKYERVDHGVTGATVLEEEKRS